MKDPPKHDRFATDSATTAIQLPRTGLAGTCEGAAGATNDHIGTPTS